jgi:hypothetical protein
MRAVSWDIRIAAGRLGAQHREAHRDHCDREIQQKLATIHQLTHRRAGRRTEHAARRIDGSAAPFHRLLAGVHGEVGEGIDRDGERAGTDGKMGVRQADEIQQRRHGEDRAAAAD